jgi:gamma-glutamyl:cysteine ligase YbdK (ATP-grasp superfamily)
MRIGTEHEYSINDKFFNPLPVSDRIIARISGAVAQEAPFGKIRIAKELQKHVLELIPARPGSLSFLEHRLYEGLRNLHEALDREYRFLGLGMHPLLKLEQTTCWDHDEKEYYDAYDRLFDISQHGWLNIQALQINIPYGSEDNLVSLYNRIRCLLPYLVAVSASSPFVEEKATPCMDNRLLYYRENQRRMPLLCNDIIPEKIGSVTDYLAINQAIYAQLRASDASILCHEWVNSRGVIIRFSRKCLEVKAIDAQECLHSDMAMAAFLLALLRANVRLDENEGALRLLLEEAIRHGTQNLKPELQKLFGVASRHATEEEKGYLPLIDERIEQGSLAEVLQRRFRQTGRMAPLLEEAAASLMTNRPLGA